MKQLKPLFAALIVMVVMVSVPGQQSIEGQIQALRENIQRLMANAPPADNPDEAGFRTTLRDLRNQLRDLLIEKRGALKNRIHNLEGPGALPEVLAHVDHLKGELQAVNNDVQTLTEQLGADVGVVAVPVPQPEPVAVAPPEPENQNPPPPGHEAAVNEVSDEDLARAAAPPEVGKSEAIVACDVDGAPVGDSSRLDKAICDFAEEINRQQRSSTIAKDQFNLFTILTAKLLKTNTSGGESYASFVTEAQEMRTDQQIGTEPSNSSATSLVSKGGIPYLFGLAVENGAAEQSEKDTSITFRVNPGGLLNLFANKGFITGFQGNADDPSFRFLKKTSLGLTFDTTRGNTPGVFTGSGQQLSQVSARIEFVNERDPRHKKYEAEWERFVADQGVKLSDQVWNMTVATVNLDADEMAFRDPALQAWLNQMNDSLAQVSKTPGDVNRINAVAKVLREQADLVPVELVSAETIAALTGFAKQDKEYEEQKDKIFDKIAKGKVFTLDYTNKREVNASDTSSFNFIAATGTGGRVDLTANGSFTLFHKRPLSASPTTPRPGRFRDFQFAGQVLVPFKVGDLGQFDFWFSGRYQRLLTDATTTAGAIMPGTSGDIAVGQFGLNIPIASLGIKFPVSFTFANRTELVREKEIRGNFGFTFNWDTIFSKLKPF